MAYDYDAMSTAPTDEIELLSQGSGIDKYSRFINDGRLATDLAQDGQKRRANAPEALPAKRKRAIRALQTYLNVNG